MPDDSTKRFSDRVDDYIRYRPGYPREAIALLEAEVGLGPGTFVADVGSGTGIFAEMLLRAGATVYGVEPNTEMRRAAERRLAACPRFRSVSGSAEATGLEDKSVDLVTAAQAFQWFHPESARAEFRRILRRDGWVALVWNDRKPDATPFLAGYEALLRTVSLDYEQVKHRNVDRARLTEFFQTDAYRTAVFPNAQHFDWQGLYGRAMSSSYVPAEGHPRHAEFAQVLRALYDRHNRDGRVEFLYDTRVYYARM